MTAGGGRDEVTVGRWVRVLAGVAGAFGWVAAAAVDVFVVRNATTAWSRVALSVAIPWPSSR